jgi:hypothetical protein
VNQQRQHGGGGQQLELGSGLSSPGTSSAEQQHLKLMSSGGSSSEVPQSTSVGGSGGTPDRRRVYECTCRAGGVPIGLCDSRLRCPIPAVCHIGGLVGLHSAVCDSVHIGS